jgi:hypothetical protein
MRAHRHGWVALALLIGGCIGPWRCDHSAPEEDFAVAPPVDLSIGELGRAPGNACTTLDNCDRKVADSCNGTCQCGNDAPCDGGRSCCDGRCVDLTTDAQNCGGCGIACPSGACVVAAGGAPHCSCDTDGGVPGCSSPLEPTCNGEGACSCGPTSIGVCNSLNADSCDNGACSCGGGPACSGALVDHCNPGHGCQCGAGPACDPALATGCDPTAQDSACRCASGPGCQPGTFCCTQNSTCCQPSQYCCLNGCCDHPCLLLGFCDH